MGDIHLISGTQLRAYTIGSPRWPSGLPTAVWMRARGWTAMSLVRGEAAAVGTGCLAAAALETFFLILLNFWFFLINTPFFILIKKKRRISMMTFFYI